MKYNKILALLMAMLMLAVPALVSAEEAAVVTTDDAGTVNELLVTVNGTEIYQDMVDEIVSYYASNYGYPEDFFKPIALQGAIENAVVTAKMEELNITLTAEEQAAAEQSALNEYNEQLEYYTEMYGQYYFGITEESTEEEIAAVRTTVAGLLESSGMSVANMLDNEIFNARYNKLNSQFIADVVVSDAEVQEEYNARVAEDMEYYSEADEDGSYGYFEYMTMYMNETSFYTPEGYREICNLVLPVEDELLKNYTELNERFEEQKTYTAEEMPTEPVTAEQVEAARQAVLDSVADEVKSIHDRMDAGETFEEISTSYGFGYKYMAHNPSLMYEKPFIEAAFSIDEIGGVSEPYVGSYGVYVVQYLFDVPAGPIAMTEDVYNVLYNELLEAAQQTAFQDVVDMWIESAEIVYTETGIAYRDAEVNEDELEVIEEDEDVIVIGGDDEPTEIVITDGEAPAEDAAPAEETAPVEEAAVTEVPAAE